MPEPVKVKIKRLLRNDGWSDWMAGIKARQLAEAWEKMKRAVDDPQSYTDRQAASYMHSIRDVLVMSKEFRAWKAREEARLAAEARWLAANRRPLPGGGS